MEPRTWSEFLNRCIVIVFATIADDGSPHAVPMEVLVRDERIYLWCENDSVKVRNVRRDPRVTITGHMGNLFVMIRGRAQTIPPDDDRYQALADGFLDKYDREEVYGNDLFIEVSPEHVVYRLKR